MSAEFEPVARQRGDFIKADADVDADSCDAEFRPQVVLLDLGLPVMDGFEVARTLRQDSRFEDVFIAALTGGDRRRRPPD